MSFYTLQRWMADNLHVVSVNDERWLELPSLDDDKITDEQRHVHGRIGCGAQHYRKIIQLQAFNEKFETNYNGITYTSDIPCDMLPQYVNRNCTSLCLDLMILDQLSEFIFEGSQSNIFVTNQFNGCSRDILAPDTAHPPLKSSVLVRHVQLTSAKLASQLYMMWMMTIPSKTKTIHKP
jgi:hypothetical protein